MFRTVFCPSTGV